MKAKTAVKKTKPAIDKAEPAVDKVEPAVKKAKRVVDDTPALSPREIEILKLICEEKSSREISHEIGTSARTVDAHRYNMMLKLRVNSVVGLVKYAVKNNFVKL